MVTHIQTKAFAGIRGEFYFKKVLKIDVKNSQFLGSGHEKKTCSIYKNCVWVGLCQSKGSYLGGSKITYLQKSVF